MKNACAFTIHSNINSTTYHSSHAEAIESKWRERFGIVYCDACASLLVPVDTFLLSEKCSPQHNRKQNNTAQSTEDDCIYFPFFSLCIHKYFPFDFFFSFTFLFALKLGSRCIVHVLQFHAHKTSANTMLPHTSISPAHSKYSTEPVTSRSAPCLDVVPFLSYKANTTNVIGTQSSITRWTEIINTRREKKTHSENGFNSLTGICVMLCIHIHCMQ